MGLLRRGFGALLPAPGSVSRPIRTPARSRVLTFRTTITLAVLTLVAALALCLIVAQIAVLNVATKAAATASMAAASERTRTTLEAELFDLETLILVLSTSPFLADSDQRSETGGAVGLFKTALRRLPHVDSLYVGYDNGCWLQVRGVEKLNPAERERIDAPAGAAFLVSLVRPTAAGALPLLRVFQDERGHNIVEQDIPQYGFDVRKRDWYRTTLQEDGATVSPPYRSFSLGSPVITLSAPLRGKARGVIAVDLKLDTFSDFVTAERPGEHGAAIIFSPAGSLIAYPQYRELVTAGDEPGGLPAIRGVPYAPVAAVMRGWNGAAPYEGTVLDEEKRANFFRLERFSLGRDTPAYLLLLAREDDFGSEVRKMQRRGLVIALGIGCCFVPAIWFFGGRISRSLRNLATQAALLETLAEPDAEPAGSRIAEIRNLGTTLHAAQRTIWSFGHFMSKEIVAGILDGSMSTRLGGTRQEVTILFTDVQNFTGIAERAEPDSLMQQTSRHFTALTEAFLAEGGTIDKYIGDAVMVFWNAPHRQHDHAARACRAALAAKAASEALNAQFLAEGMAPFITRFGIHVGEVVVGNVGSAKRMDYTALGASVNLAARLETLNKEYQTSILVSDAVRRHVGPGFRFRPLPPVIAKGMTTETLVYELLNGTGIDDVDAAASQLDRSSVPG
jgi:adenylate cyclase